MPGFTAERLQAVGILGAVRTVTVRAGELPAALLATREYTTSKLLPGVSAYEVRLEAKGTFDVLPVPVRVRVKPVKVPAPGEVHDNEVVPGVAPGDPTKLVTGSGGEATPVLVVYALYTSAEFNRRTRAATVCPPVMLFVADDVLAGRELSATHAPPLICHSTHTLVCAVLGTVQVAVATYPSL
jgi:hypothetical protein